MHVCAYVHISMHMHMTFTGTFIFPGDSPQPFGAYVCARMLYATDQLSQVKHADMLSRTCSLECVNTYM